MVLQNALVEELLEAEELRGFLEKVVAVSERVVLAAHLRLNVKCSEVVQDLDPLGATWQFPGI